MEPIWLNWVRGWGAWKVFLQTAELMELTVVLLSNKQVLFVLAGICRKSMLGSSLDTAMQQLTAAKGPKAPAKQDWRCKAVGAAFLMLLASYPGLARGLLCPVQAQSALDLSEPATWQRLLQLQKLGVQGHGRNAANSQSYKLAC